MFCKAPVSRIKLLFLSTNYFAVLFSGLLDVSCYRINVLNVMDNTANRKACMTAMQLVTDLVNNRSDILTDYQVDIDTRGEELPTKTVIDFWQSNLTDVNGNPVYKSPIMIEPLFSTNCRAIGSFLQNIGMVDISSLCKVRVLADRIRYPNVHEMITGGDMQPAAIAHFIKDFGKWSRFAILTNAGNANDYSTASALQRLSVAYDIDIPFFQIATDFDDDSIENLKTSDARIIAILISDNILVWKVLCLFYKHAITGSRYVFILNKSVMRAEATSFFGDANVVPGCKSSMLATQFRYSFWTGPTVVTEDDRRTSQLGYNLRQFDEMLVNREANVTQSDDYEQRTLCHDTMLRALLSLDAAEKQLKLQNTTLRDFSGNNLAISRTVNTIVSRLNFYSLRLGNTHYEDDFLPAETSLFQYYTGGQYWKNERTIAHGVSTHPHTFSRLSIIPVGDFDWWAWGNNGKPPNDQANYQHIIKTVNTEVMQLVLALAIMLCILQVLAVSAILYIRNFDNKSNPFPRSKIAGLFGCAVLASCSVVFIMNTSYSPSQIWVARIVLLTAGLEIAYTVQSLRAIALSGEVSNYHIQLIRRGIHDQGRPAGPSVANGVVASAAPAPLPKNLAPPRRSSGKTWAKQTSSAHSESPPRSLSPVALNMPDNILAEADTLSLSGVGIFLAMKSCIVGIWLIWDPMKCGEEVVAAETYYNNDVDTFVKTVEIACRGNYYIVWLLAIALGHLVTISIGLFCIHQINKSSRMVECPDFASMAIGACSSLIILVGTMLIMCTLNSAVSNETAAAFSTLLMSGFTSVTLSYGCLSEAYRRLKDSNLIFPFF